MKYFMFMIGVACVGGIVALKKISCPLLYSKPCLATNADVCRRCCKSQGGDYKGCMALCADIAVE